MTNPEETPGREKNAVASGHATIVTNTVQARSPGRRITDVEAIVNADRLAKLELIAADNARMAKENANKRISTRISYAIAGFAMMVTLALFFTSQGKIEDQQKRIAALSRANTEQIKTDRMNRISSGATLCRQENGQHRILRGIIISGARRQPPEVEALFKQLGLPGPSERVAQAKVNADRLPIVQDCDAAAADSVRTGDATELYPLAKLEVQRENQEKSKGEKVGQDLRSPDTRDMAPKPTPQP